MQVQEIQHHMSFVHGQMRTDTPMVDADRSTINKKAYWDFVKGLKKIQQLEVMLAASFLVYPPSCHVFSVLDRLSSGSKPFFSPDLTTSAHSH